MLTEKLSQFITEKLPFQLADLPSSACLVGGAVRDALLSRHRDYLDLDFVLPDGAVEIARQLAHQYRRGFVVLDAERKIARVVFEQGTVDFAEQEGKSLEIDLKRRDFTINAIAYNPHNHFLIDPLNGLKDLEKGVLRMVSAQNLAEDPLRLLRAYRQAAQLHFTIDTDTRSTICTFAPLIEKIAAERVQSELNYLLKNPQGIPWIKEAWADQLLSFWLPNITEKSLQALSKIDQLYDDYFPSFYQKKKTLDTLFLSKLSLLISPQVETAHHELTRLKYSRAEVRALTKVINSLESLRIQLEPMSIKDQYFLFLDLKDTFPILALSGLALEIATPIIQELIQHYNDPQDALAHPQPLISGNDLIESLNLKPSPLIGELLTDIQLGYIEGKINSKQEALLFVKAKI